jgi:hypothetical protein
MDTPRPSQFRVEKRRLPAVLTLANGESIRGCFFVAEASARHSGPERVGDVLNAEAGFFPFEIGRAAGTEVASTALFNRSHVVMVGLGENEAGEPAYGIVTRRVVSLLLSIGRRVVGAVQVYLPEGRDRLSDWAQHGERFRYLETPEGTTLVNVEHIVEARESAEA